MPWASMAALPVHAVPGQRFVGCDVEPYAYLRHVLTELPKHQPGADIADLLPFNFVTA